ncbi:hypothetical protein [Acanthopleuribacter pedis]|uniref:Uncharacterized protein n=1 Tax=Acanthopleuribacter pedis TaxID=442870 RepID=A0A8J7QDB1_9BACT|nr:hypothetical protein [Acanthopleuribacter pedis]MBO1318956.1 hypothetical protein [Acanthopleuribacter pedis]
MSHETILYGMIDAGELERDTLNPHYALNQAALDALGDEDDDPVLLRGMFSIAPPRARFSSQVIHFGASYEGLEKRWDRWLEKFEALLRTMYWFNAVVHLDSELFEGDYRYEWMLTDKAFDDCLIGDTLKPIYEWEFTGGPRLFDV